MMTDPQLAESISVVVMMSKIFPRRELRVRVLGAPGRGLRARGPGN
jgi:hypothetical protein